MIEADYTVFPNNAVNVLKARIETIDPDLVPLRRPLRKSDPVQSVGIYATYWTPGEESYEMRGGTPPRHQPTLSSYTITIEAFVKDMDEERGLATHSVLTSLIRSMLYRDDVLLIALRSLSVSVMGNTERVQRVGIKSQRYASNELQGTFLYLSVFDFFVETETV